MQKLAEIQNKEKNEHGQSKNAVIRGKASGKSKRKRSKRTYIDYWLECRRKGCEANGKRQRKGIPTTGQANKLFCEHGCIGDGRPLPLSSRKTSNKYWKYVLDLDEHGERVEAHSDEETDEENDENDESDDNDDQDLQKVICFDLYIHWYLIQKDSQSLC